MGKELLLKRKDRVRQPVLPLSKDMPIGRERIKRFQWEEDQRRNPPRPRERRY